MIRNLYYMEVSEVTNIDELRAYSTRHQLHSSQLLLSPEGLLALHSSADRGMIYCLSDLFYMEIVVAVLQNRTLFFGPFAPVPISEKDARDILRNHRITELSSHDLLLYREAYPELEEDQVIHIVNTLIRIYDPDSGIRQVRKSASLAQQMEGEEQTADSRQHYSAMLQRRYEYEQRFMEDIRQGNADDAIQNLHRMQRDVSYLKRIGTALESERVGAAITRTTVRLVALDAGLSSLVADQLSSANTKLTLQARTISQILSAKDQMVRAFCTAIREQKEHQHSALALNAAWYLRSRYSRKIQLVQMADDLGCSKSRLINVFRKEYGTTPIAYLNHYRMEQAALLLTSTDYTIQEISSQVGIDDANYFVKLFRCAYQTTPSLYRRHQS